MQESIAKMKPVRIIEKKLLRGGIIDEALVGCFHERPGQQGCTRCFENREPLGE
jgi:hypothetical protein